MTPIRINITPMQNPTMRNPAWDAPNASLAPDLGAVEAQYGLPAGILSATSTVESSNNPRTPPSSAGAIGQFQIMPATAKALGIDPSDPRQAAEGAARLWRQNLDRTGGDIDQAARMYTGGPDPSKWGAQTNAYPGKLLAALNRRSGPQSVSPAAPQPDASDPFEAALAGVPTRQPAAPVIATQQPVDATDPYEAALAGGNGGNASQAPNGSVGRGVGTAGPGGAGAVACAGVGPYARGTASPVSGAPGGIMVGGGAAGSAGGQPSTSGAGYPQANSSVATPPGGKESSIVHALADAGIGAFSGFVNDVGGGATELLGRGTDALGLTQGAGDWAAAKRQRADAADAAHEFVPNGLASTIGRVSGQVVGTLPLGEVGVLSKLGPIANAGERVMQAAEGGVRASPYARALATAGRIGDAAIGGAAGGAIVSTPGSDPASNAALGAKIGAGVGVVSPVAGRAFAAAAPHLKAMADAVLSHVRTPSPAAAVVAPDMKALGAAVLSRGDRRGLAANVSNIPRDVMAMAQHLMGQGVELAPALREAEAVGIGAKPLSADVTRDAAAQRLTKQAASKLGPEADGLRAQIAGNNEAAHNAVTDLIDQYGGQPARGSAVATAQQSLADASDRSRQGVKKLYQAADDASGNARIVDLSALRAHLDTPEMANPTTDGLKTLGTGLRGYIDALGPNVTATQADSVRKAIGDAYDPMGSGINHHVGQLKAMVDAAMDDAGTNADYLKAARARQSLGLPSPRVAALTEDLKAARAAKGLGMPGDHDATIARLTDEIGKPVTLDPASAYKAARAAFKEHAGQYDVPGVADLIARDAKGNFVGSAPVLDRGLVGTMDDRPFVNVVRQLQANGDTPALDKIKASLLQDAYEKASAGQPDESGRALLSGTKFLDHLNGIGETKLGALFSPEEQGNISAIGRGIMHVNEPVRGGVGGGSPLAASLQVTQREAPTPPKRSILASVGAHGGLLTAGAVAGHELLAAGLSAGSEAALHVASKARVAAHAKELSRALQATMTPSYARTQAQEHAAGLARAVAAYRAGNGAARLAATVAATASARR